MSKKNQTADFDLDDLSTPAEVPSENSVESPVETKVEVDLYDFTNTDDLPSELASKLNSVRVATQNQAKAYAEIVANAPMPLSISQIMAVATRKWTAARVPGIQTVRSYLNIALDEKMISKPTRQTYSKYDAALPIPGADEDDAE